MARVFVSHAGQDLVLAARLHSFLTDNGHDVFLDQDLDDGIVVGEDWEERLHERLRWADVVVCVLTAAFTRSLWCTAETGIARSRGCRLLPVLAEPDVEHPLLARIHHLDATRDEADAFERVNAALRRVDAVGGHGWPDDRSPFPGLRPFERDEHRAFFGRRAEAAQLAARLRAPAHPSERTVLVVVGPSGSGKSSLVRAGLLPVIGAEPEWMVLAPFVPGHDPRAALGRELVVAARELGLDWSAADVRSRLEDDHGLADLADDLLLASSSPGQRRLLVVIDQMEELLTQTAPEERRRFALLIRSALASSVRVLGTLRPEFLDRLLVDQSLAELKTVEYSLRPLHGDALRDVIEKPAELAGITLDEGLAERLVTDTRSGEALPLLAFTLARLADGVEHGGRLLISRYEQLGGVSGALAQQADVALAEAMAAGGREKDAVIRELLNLVTVDENSRPTRRRVARDELQPAARDELDCFVARRLLVTDTESRRAMVGVAHEAFLSAWPPLRSAVEADLSALRARRRIEEAADEWAAATRSSDLLWTRGRLAGALADVGARPHGVHSASTTSPSPSGRARTLATDRVELSDRARDFLQEARRRDRNRRRRSTTVLSLLLVLALATSVGFVGLWRNAEDQRKGAVYNQVLSQAGRLETVDTALTAQLNLVARHMNPTDDTFAAVLTSENTALPTALPGPTDRVTTVAFTPDRRFAAASGDDGMLRLWDLTAPSGAHAIDPVASGSPVGTIALQPSGRLLATGGGDGVVRLWAVEGGPALSPMTSEPSMGHLGYVRSVAFSSDGRVLTTASRNEVRLWDVSAPATPVLLAGPLVASKGDVSDARISADGHTLVSASEDGTVQLWDSTDVRNVRPLGQPVQRGEYSVLAAAFSPDGRTLATGNGDRTVRLWDVSNPTRPVQVGQPLLGHTDFVNSVTFSPDGQALATGGGDSTVRLWNVANTAAVVPLGRPLPTRATVMSVAFDADGRHLLSGGNDGELDLWSLPTYLRLGGYGAANKYTHAVTFSPDERMVASGDVDGSVRVWDVRDPDRPRALDPPAARHQGDVGAVVFSPDGRTLATGGDDGTVRFWDAADPSRLVQVGALPETGSRVWSLAFRPDGRLLAVGRSDGHVRLWDVSVPNAPSARSESVAIHTKAVNSLAFTPDGRTLASASSDYTARLWDVSDPAFVIPRSDRPAEHNLYVNAVALSPDGRIMATGSADTTVRLWDVSDPAHVVPFPAPLLHNSPVFALAFAPDGMTLATGTADNTVRLWAVGDPANPVLRGRPLTAHTDIVSGLAFSPSGRTLVSSSRDQTMRLWNMDVTQETKRICATTAGALTPEAWKRYVSEEDPFEPPCSAARH